MLVLLIVSHVMIRKKRKDEMIKKVVKLVNIITLFWITEVKDEVMLKLER